MGIKAMIARCTARIDVLPQIAIDAAVQIQADARNDARTRAGNVPLFKGKPKWSADVPITAIARGDRITVTAIDWAMSHLRRDGRPREWIATIQRTALERLRAIR